MVQEGWLCIQVLAETTVPTICSPWTQQRTAIPVGNRKSSTRRAETIAFANVDTGYFPGFSRRSFDLSLLPGAGTFAAQGANHMVEVAVTELAQVIVTRIRNFESVGHTAIVPAAVLVSVEMLAAPWEYVGLT